MSSPGFEFDVTDVERPHLQKLTKELQGLAQENWDSLTVLSEVLTELLFRQRKLALQLRADVVERIIELQRESFRWPSTEAPVGTGRLGNTEWQDISLLKFMGYAVGQNGATAGARRAILDYVYLRPVPRVSSPEYMAKWGAPRTGERLNQMAENIAASTRNAKRNRTRDFSLAIEEWEDDLEYLRLTYYVGSYDFWWPSTDV